MAMGRRRHRLRTDVGRPHSHHRRVPFSGVTGASGRGPMLADRTEHEPSETRRQALRCGRVRARGTPAASLQLGRSSWTPWPSGHGRRCRSRGRLFCRLAVLRQCLLAERGARPEFPQRMPIARAPGRERKRGARRRGAGVTRRTGRSPWCTSSPAGNSNWGAGNLVKGAPAALLLGHVLINRYR